MARYSIFSLARNALTGHRDWPELWRSPEPRPAYEVVIVGGGGHGLATAYYLAKEHGVTDVAVVEKGWLAGGNIARNTTIIRSNYLWDESAAIYEHGLKLWEGLSRELNFNVMFSPRGVLNLGHTLQDSPGRIVGSRGKLVDSQPLILQDSDVGEGAANVNANDGLGHVAYYSGRFADYYSKYNLGRQCQIDPTRNRALQCRLSQRVNNYLVGNLGERLHVRFVQAAGSGGR